MIESKSRIDSPTGSSGWMDHWGLNVDPFLGSALCYVPLSAHEEAIARLTYLIESGQPLGILSGESGTGKTTVLERLRRLLRSPERRIVSLHGPLSGGQLAFKLSKALGMPGDLRSLQDSVRVQGWQRTHLIVIVDECPEPITLSDAAELKWLMDCSVHGATRITLIVTTADEQLIRDRPEFREGLPARLDRLTRAETTRYLSEKLRRAGRSDDAFNPKAFTRIHAVGGGIPRTLDRLASLCLIAGASQGLEIISQDLVDETGRELWPEPGVAGRAFPVWIRSPDS